MNHELDNSKQTQFYAPGIKPNLWSCLKCIDLTLQISIIASQTSKILQKLTNKVSKVLLISACRFGVKKSDINRIILILLLIGLK